MNENRPDIPASLRRAVLVEAGHRCAIPTCRATTIEVAHIEPWAVVKAHEPENLIALCPNCHTRFDRGEIDRKAMLIYKQKLIFLSERYSRFEMRVLEHLKDAPRALVPGILMVKALLDDNLVELENEESSIDFDDGYHAMVTGTFRLTPIGRNFLERWAAATSAGLTYYDAAPPAQPDR